MGKEETTKRVLNQNEIIKNVTNEKGQMAIFIALIFQVLFVFFAMIINIGLIVHDKINLQNSVDLAAYYGAQRQAEILNAIAHENYQIHQAWKLLSWRVRILGDLGNNMHPFNQGRGLGDQPFPGGRSPSVCVNHNMWGINQNICKTSSISIPPIPPSPVLMPPVTVGGLVALLAHIQVNNAINIAKRDCNDTGPLNYNMALKWLGAYKVQMSRAKEALRIYADNLSGAGDFRDIRGESTKQGVQNTLVNNLTRANSASFSDDKFVFYNSLGVGDRRQWLNEALIAPEIYYTYFEGSSNSACHGTVRSIWGTPARALSSEEKGFYYESEDPSYLYNSIYGVEKNPWMMAYVGVYAETTPRKPYLPFGKPITLRAKAYAKPFGGRIGPWIYKTWPRSSLKSQGSEKTDLLTPLIRDPDNPQINTQNANGLFTLPNYSRYPGDALGLTSWASANLFREWFDRKISASRAGIHLQSYSAVPSDTDGLAMGLSQFPDVNNSNALGYSAPWIREFEMAALAPDLFDLAYYSIDADFNGNYIQPALRGGLIPQEKVTYDYGSYGQVIKTVRDQLELANQIKTPQSASNFFLVKDWMHLLNAWAPSGPYEYHFPEDSFGSCEVGGKIPVPGRCAVGGRVGYSVKIISEDYLTSSDLSLGGSGDKGPILNPPPF